LHDVLDYRSKSTHITEEKARRIDSYTHIFANNINGTALKYNTKLEDYNK